MKQNLAHYMTGFFDPPAPAAPTPSLGSDEIKNSFANMRVVFTKTPPQLSPKEQDCINRATD